jgi:IPT/TIG domain/S-layer homology domain
MRRSTLSVRSFPLCPMLIGGLAYFLPLITRAQSTATPLPLPSPTPTPTFWIKGLSATSGPASGNTDVLVFGAGFQSGATLSFGGVAATGVQGSSMEVEGMTPALPAGTLQSVSVTNPGPISATLPAGWFADFFDVTQSDPVHSFVEKIARKGITGGCGGGDYCPTSPTTRAEMAVFLLKFEHGAAYAPPTCTGIFHDVPCPGGFAVDWIEQLFNEGITGGCDGSNYCPNAPVRRDQMAVLLLKTRRHGTGFVPPPCSGIFGDVPCPGPFTDWVEELHFEGLTAGCQASPLLYCPANSVSRGQMSVFLAPRTFSVDFPECQQVEGCLPPASWVPCGNFSPVSTYVHVGDSVQWLGGSGQPPHTTTSGQCSHPPTSCNPDGLWNLPQDSASYTFTQPGIFPYFCEVGYWGVVSMIGNHCHFGTLYETGVIIVDP